MVNLSGLDKCRGLNESIPELEVSQNCVVRVCQIVPSPSNESAFWWFITLTQLADLKQGPRTMEKWRYLPVLAYSLYS